MLLPVKTIVLSIRKQIEQNLKKKTIDQNSLKSFSVAKRIVYNTEK